MKAPPPQVLAISPGATGSGGAASLDLLAWLEMVAAVPGVGVLIREKQVDDRDLFDFCTSARATFPGTLLVSERTDVALACGFDGVHLSSRGLPAATVVSSYRSRLLVGVSTHSLAEVAAARDHGADYVLFGPVFATPAKARFGAPQGLAKLARAVACGVRLLAVGGIDRRRLDGVLAAGAYGVAAIRAAANRHLLEELVAGFGRPR